MIVAIASGKGGTGKTLLTAALATAWPDPLAVADLDVEAPNLHLLLEPDIDTVNEARLEVPEADPERCDGCGKCADLCQFRAIAVFGTFPAVFPELCHGCGGCLMVCPTGALKPGFRMLGDVCQGHAGEIRFLMGRLRIGEAMSPPLIRNVQEQLLRIVTATGRDALIDSPPGASCPAVTAVGPADVVLLITEPTPFGLHDLKRARHAFADLGKPMAVVVNRAGIGDGRVRDYCRVTGLPVLGEIPFDPEIANAPAPVWALAARHGARIAAIVSGIADLFDESVAGKEAVHA